MSDGLEAAKPPGALAELASRWALLPTGRMHALTNAAPPPANAACVVLVHGMVVASGYMIPAARHLAPRCRVYAVDLPGYGRSDKPWPILQLPQLADALAEYLSAVGVARAHVAGNSFGCQIAAEFALRHPQRLGRLVLQGPTVDPAARSLPRQFWRLLVNGRREPHDLQPVLWRDYHAAGLRRAWATLRIVMRDRIEDKLPRIAAPTLVLRGSRDPVVPQAWAEQAARLLPRGELRVVAGATHTLNFAAPREFAQAIAEFVLDR